jgi:hypothetical protein
MKNRIEKYRIMLSIFILACLCLCLFGCKKEDTGREKIRDIEFTVVSGEDTPEELAVLIDERKQNEFKLTYKTEDAFYVIRGYGVQTTGGYSVAINECYLTSNAIYFKTNLIGPDKTQEIPEAQSYPYVIIKMEYLDKTIVFQ